MQHPPSNVYDKTSYGLTTALQKSNLQATSGYGAGALMAEGL
jgi:hypothetical protein